LAKSFYGLIGYPLLQSFSPGYFNEKFQREGIDAEYFTFPLETIDLFPELLKAHPGGLRGINVTIPYKTAVIPFLNELNEDVKKMGAVNCILIKEGKLLGYNTDWVGFHDSLKPLLKPHHKQALILGSGGAAKAVAYALRQLGISYKVVTRGNPDSPMLHYSSVTPALLQEYTLLINTTPLGMAPNEDRAPELPYEALTDKHLLYDVIYNPAETKFLQLGKSQGATIKNGIDMLHLQAEGSWRIWNG
jgi:shikimate dehydrogenase